jgi:nickel transport system permease protein
LLIIALLAVVALTSQWWLPYDPQAIDLPSRLLPPGSQHWLGTDHLGRDIFSRLLAATRVSLGSVMACLLLVLALGLLVGCAGLIGGRVDQATMRVADLFMTFPTSILSFFMVGVLGTGLTNVIIAIALSHWAWYARMVRSLTISLRQREFVLAARLSGAGHMRVFVDHLAGAVIPSLLVLATLDIGHMMLHVAGMSFLGLGVTAPTAEWG